MSVAAQYIPAAYSLTAVGVWGASDFLGGVGARRANAFLFTAIVHISGMVLMGTLALITHAPFPGNASLVWSLIAGSVGGMALALFYRSLASGNMGLVAPVAAVVGAAIPTIVAAFAEGFPGYRHVLGFVVAGIGVWLISRAEGDAGRPRRFGHGCAGWNRLCRFLSLHSPGGPRLGIVDFGLLARRFAAGHRSDRFIRKIPARGARAGAGPCRGCRESSTSPAAPSSSAPLKSDAWTMRSCSVRSIPRSPLCWLAFFYTSTSAAPGPSAWSRRWRLCR